MAKDEAWWADYNAKLAKASKGGTKQLEWGLGTGGGSYVSCYDSHKPLKIGDTGLVVHGGSCSHPTVKDADVYIGFDGGMRMTAQHYPWTPGHEILYRITDMAAPLEITQFRKLVEWTAEQLKGGSKVHCGCIGGHGRTGTFLAALVTHMTGITDSIAYVRENYCKKAVETHEQITYLGKHFGVTSVKGTKEYGGKMGKYTDDLMVPASHHKTPGPKKDRGSTVAFVQDGNSIWGGRCS
jgi:hypothetical protein